MLSFSPFSASDLSEIGEELRTDDGISRTSGSSSMDLGGNENGPADDTSSIHAVSSQGGNQVTKQHSSMPAIVYDQNKEVMELNLIQSTCLPCF